EVPRPGDPLSGVFGGRTYHYRVIAIDTQNNEEAKPSNTVSISVQSEEPPDDQPGDPQGDPQGDHQGDDRGPGFPGGDPGGHDGGWGGDQQGDNQDDQGDQGGRRGDRGGDNDGGIFSQRLKNAEAKGMQMRGDWRKPVPFRVAGVAASSIRSPRP